MSSDAGTIYLLHFAKPYKHARHYLGWAQHLEARLEHHRAGTGARLMQVVREAGIDWEVSRTWEGDRNLERKLKQRKESPRLCPICMAREKHNPKGEQHD
jgi:predicted GIY-YIG superfamily endonuclease